MTNPYTVRTRQVMADSDSAADIFAALHDHFGSSPSFESILPTPTADHTIYIQPRGLEPWRQAFSTIGAASSASFAGSLEPNKATAPDGLNPSTGATAQWSGIADRQAGAKSKFMLVTEIEGLGHDSVFVHFYTDSGGTRANPYKNSLHFGRVLSPMIEGVPGLDGLGMFSGNLSWNTSTIGGSVATTLNQPLFVRNLVSTIPGNVARIRIGPTQWNIPRYQWSTIRSTGVNNQTALGRMAEPVFTGSNSASGVTANDHNETPMVYRFNHLALWYTNLVAGAIISDAQQEVSFLCAGDSNTTTSPLANTHNQVLARMEYGADVTP